MIKKIFLLSGVHGVGKGHFIDEKLKDVSNISAIGASTLIEKYKKSEDSGYKKVKDVSENQRVLLGALKQLQNDANKDILLDGHLCIINSLNSIERIPESFMIEAPISGIILLQECVSEIVQRQKLRDGITLSKSLIEKIQTEEKEYAEFLLKKLNIPYKIISSKCDKDQFLKLIHEMGGMKL